MITLPRNDLKKQKMLQRITEKFEKGKEYSEQEVNHIYSSVKKPTTCEKIERFWRTHNDERWKFSSLRKLINYYNYKRQHMSLDYKTPYEVWKKDLKV